MTLGGRFYDSNLPNKKQKARKSRAYRNGARITVMALLVLGTHSTALGKHK
jgi:hypothetical protein